MYYASTLINGHPDATIIVRDGQNEDVIMDYTNNDYHPCLPWMTDGEKNARITVYFSSNVTSMEHWFPSNCTSLDHSGYENEYMFDGALSWTFYNLIVDDYDVSDGYPLVRSSESVFWLNGLVRVPDIECNHCIFQNITDDHRSGKSLFETYASLHFYDSIFRDISTNNGAMINVTGVDDTGERRREIEVEDCVFENVVVSESMFHFQETLQEVK